jgi:nicotinate-nucleotide adenylyltransferase
MKLGVLGGTFDPIHNGHIRIAAEVREKLGLDRVLFVIAGQNPFKDAALLTPSGNRLKMLELAIEGKAEFAVSRIELDRRGPSYTVDTLTELRRGLDSTDEIFFILGWDSLVQIPRWKNAARIIELCKLVAVPRPGVPRPDLDALNAHLPGLNNRVILMQGPEIDVSSSEIRRRVAEGLPITNMVPPEVEKYILDHKLYAGRSGE